MSSGGTQANDPGSAQPPRSRADDLVAKLVERIGGRMAASTVYGTPVERDGVTVIPVARARFGVGAGGGTDPNKGQEGEGGGAGGMFTPAGYIELKGGRSRFVPLVHPARMLALICCTVLAGLAIVRAVGVEPRRSALPWR